MYKLILIILLIPAILPGKTNVLLIGNSLSELYIEMRLQEMADSAGKDLFIHTQSLGGHALMEHLNYEFTKEWIDSMDWDYVFLQPATFQYKPGWNDNECDYYIYNAADTLNRWIKENNPCTETAFYMYWGYRDNYAQAEEQIRENAIRYAKEFDAMTIPVGMVWREVRKSRPDIELYRDGIHGSHPGLFLVASTFYAFIFNETPYGVKLSDFAADENIIGVEKAEYLQQVAGNIVLDSLEQWNYYFNKPQSEFTYTITEDNLTVNFNSDKSSPALRHNWEFGDGNSSEEQSPVHQYASGGTYPVRHGVQSDCYPTSITDTTLFITVGVNDDVEEKGIEIYPNPAREYIEITNPTPNPSPKERGVRVEIFDVLGKSVLRNTPENLTPALSKGEGVIRLDVSHLQPGIYFVRVGDEFLKLVKM